MTSYTPVKLSYKTSIPEDGASDKAPVIFAHGFTGSHLYWRDCPQIVANVTKRKVYAIDARNHGDSEWSDVFNFDCNVDDLLHFMDTLDIPKAVLIGSSMGGVTSIKTALGKPERVEKLIVEDMNVQKIPPQLFSTAPMFFALAKSTLQHIPAEADEEAAKQVIVERIFRQLPEEMTKFVKPEVLEQNIPLQLKRIEDGRYAYKANLDVLETAVKNPSQIMTDHEGVYDGPALFIYGKLSPLNVGSDEQNIKNHFPNAELIEMEKASHAVYLDCPEEYTEAVINFITRE